ncbi:MAG TPA: DEAD/DEAH box helicase [Stenomitos sp.]
MTQSPTFQNFDLPDELLSGLKRRGFKEPTPIQALVIPEVGKGRDLIVQAQTGSGKTLAFGLPILKREPVDERAPTALVIAPTRELAKQIRQELISVSGTMERSIVAVPGGESLDKQVSQLKKGAHVVVGTPGRLVDLMERGALNLKHVKVLVLDEADEILAKGFEKELMALVQRMPDARQTMLFSATMPAAVQRLADEALNKPHRIKVAEAPETPREIDHFMLEVADETRLSALVSWLKTEKPFMAMVFCRTRTETEWLADQLTVLGFENEYLSGELSQAKRSRILEAFRTGDLPLLIATDLAARGIDVPGVTHVVNYTVPTTVETYVHRTGRTGRAGRKGVALTLVAPSEQRAQQAIQKLSPMAPWRGLVIEPLPRKIPTVAPRRPGGAAPKAGVARRPAQAAPQKPAQGAARQSASGTAQKPSQGPARKPGQGPTQKPGKGPGGKPGQGPSRRGR